MQDQSGNIQLILGPMFSGKSSELIKLIRRYNIKKHKTVVIKFNLDDRYETGQTNVISHDKVTYPAIKCGRLSEVKDILLKHEVIGIDEGQFFPDLAEVCEELANNGKHIVIAALNANFKRESFPAIASLFPKCEKIINLQSICYYCNDDAPFTLRTVGGEDEIVIGGLEMYKPVCRLCYNIKSDPEQRNTREEVKSDSSKEIDEVVEVEELISGISV